MRNLYEELTDYTGLHKDLVWHRCQYACIELAYQWGKHEGSILDFYRNTDLYIYDLTYYQHDILGDGFYNDYKDFFKNHKIKSGLDLGGGIGEYTITAIEFKVEMDFIELDGKTLDYAKWRFKRHNAKPHIHHEDFKIDRDYDFIVAMDVLEHLENPQERIKEIAAHTEYLIANPEKILYSWLYPMHISAVDLTEYFDHVKGELWQRKRTPVRQNL